MQRKDYTNHCRRDSGNFHIFKESDKKHPTMEIVASLCMQKNMRHLPKMSKIFKMYILKDLF